MLREPIAAGLPEGHSRPLYVQWHEGGAATAWVRAGDLRREGASFVMVPRWDGQAFALLWRAAEGADPGHPADPLVAFAVPEGRSLALLATVRVSPSLRRRVRHAAADARRR